MKSYPQTSLPSKRCQDFLQNILDSAYNSLRKKNIVDEPQRVTDAIVSKEQDNDIQQHPEEDADNSLLEGDLLDELIGLLQQVDNTVINRMLPKTFSTLKTKERGCSKCGFSNLALMKPLQEIPENHENNTNESRDDTENEETTTEVRDHTNEDNEEETNDDCWLQVSSDIAYMPPRFSDGTDFSSVVPARKDIVNVFVRRRSRLLRAEKICRSQNEVMQANETAESIAEWGREGKFDDGQQQAFEIMTAMFVLLTFYNEKGSLDYSNPQDLLIFERERKKLIKLADWRKRKSNQLIALMHGPGGAGKSWVVDLVLLYAKEYCSFLDNFDFDKRTILVTAMTGCATTLLNGETTYGAFKLNTSKIVDAKDEQEWKNTRLAIIDEVSLASKEDIILMNQKLQ